MSTPGSMTVLRCQRGHRATKVVRPVRDDWVEILGYDAGWLFGVEENAALGLHELAEALAQIIADPAAFVIRAEPLPGVDRRGARRLLHPHHGDDGTMTPPTFRDVPRSWVILDIDSLPAPAWLDPCDGRTAAAYCRPLLPPPWQTATCWWALSASAGFKPGIRIKLAFWLNRPMLGADIQRHLEGCPIDPSTLRAVQPIFLAAPILAGGIADPVPERCGIALGVDEIVKLPDLPPRPRSTLPTHNPQGQRYAGGLAPDAAQRKLARLCGAIERAPFGGRHHCLLWAAIRAVEIDDALPRTTIAAELVAAARRAGLEDHDAELIRQIRNGFRIGIFGTGEAA